MKFLSHFILVHENFEDKSHSNSSAMLFTTRCRKCHYIDMKLWGNEEWRDFLKGKVLTLKENYVGFLWTMKKKLLSHFNWNVRNTIITNKTFWNLLTKWLPYIMQNCTIGYDAWWGKKPTCLNFVSWPQITQNLISTHLMNDDALLNYKCLSKYEHL